MKRRSIVVEIDEEAPDLPLVIVPPGRADLPMPFEAIVVASDEPRFSLRTPGEARSTLAIEDAGVRRAGWRLRGELSRNGPLPSVQAQHDWGAPELRIRAPNDSLPQCVRLTLQEGHSLIVGRSESNCDVAVDDDTVSRRHARFSVQGGAVYVEDLGSTWGTFVDDVRIGAPTPLADRAQIRIGHTQIDYVAIFVALQKLTQPHPTETEGPEPEEHATRLSRIRRFVSLAAWRERATRIDVRFVPLALGGIAILGLAAYVVMWLAPFANA
jgi:hypothetical protein